MLASINDVSPFPPITSLQSQHYQEIARSFAQRQTSMPSIINNLRTLSVDTRVVPPFAPSPTHLRHAPPASVAISFCFINLEPLCSFPQSQGVWNQANAASFAKHPRGGW